MTDALNLVRWGEKELTRSKIANARHDAETLFTHSFNTRRENIYVASFELGHYGIDFYKDCIRIRASHFPLQYLLKSAEFMGLPIGLESGVFIPRQETEVLVEKTLQHIKSLQKKRAHILDMGTGSGNIAISLTKYATGCRIIACDISAKALKTAAKNARANGVEKRIKFVKSNFFDKISSVYYNNFDVIISNPPYIRRNELRQLQPEIAYEDRAALDGGGDGLKCYRRILSDGVRYLKKGGIFAFEIGYDQSGDMARLLKKDGRFSDIVFFKDYSGHKRVAIAKYRRENK